MKLFIALIISTCIFPLRCHAAKIDDGYFFTNSIEVCIPKKNISVDNISRIAINQNLNYCDILSMNADELRFSRNSIYAQNGESFQSKNLQENFSIENLTKVQRGNAEKILALEELVRRKPKYEEEDSYFYSLNNQNFAKIDDYLINLSSFPKSHPEISAINKHLIFKRTGKNLEVKAKQKTNSDREIRQGDIEYLEPEITILNDGVLVAEQAYYVGIEGSECESNVYNFDGSLINHPGGLDYCPKYSLKNNKNLLVRAENTSCCGAVNYSFATFNTKNGNSVSLPTRGDLCLLTYLSETNDLLVVTYNAIPGDFVGIEFFIIDSDGNFHAYGNVVNIYKNKKFSGFPFWIKYLTGYAVLNDTNEYVFRFNDRDCDGSPIYLKLSDINDYSLEVEKLERFSTNIGSSLSINYLVQ